MKYLPSLLLVTLIVLTFDIEIPTATLQARTIDERQAEGFVAFVVNENKTEQTDNVVACTCKGEKFITHGDGHRTPCPCENCTCSKPTGSDVVTEEQWEPPVVETSDEPVVETEEPVVIETDKSMEIAVQEPKEVEVYEESDEEIAREYKHPVYSKYYIIKWTAPWCVHCKEWDVKNREKLTSFGINVTDLDIDKNRELYLKYNVKYIPSVWITRRSDLITYKKFTNASAETLIDAIDKLDKELEEKENGKNDPG